MRSFRTSAWNFEHLGDWQLTAINAIEKGFWIFNNNLSSTIFSQWPSELPEISIARGSATCTASYCSLAPIILDPPPLEIGIRILHSLPAKTSPHRRPPEPMKYPDASGQEVHLLYSVNMTAPDTSAKKQEDTPHGAKNALFTAVGRV